MKTNELKKITKRYVYGKGEGTGSDSWFKIITFNDGENKDYIIWVKVNGGWYLWTDSQGNYKMGAVRYDIKDVYTENQGRYLSGDKS